MWQRYAAVCCPLATNSLLPERIKAHAPISVVQLVVSDTHAKKKRPHEAPFFEFKENFSGNSSDVLTG